MITQHYWAPTSGEFPSLDEQKAAQLDLKQAYFKFGEGLFNGLPPLSALRLHNGLPVIDPFSTRPCSRDLWKEVFDYCKAWYGKQKDKKR
jgi:hypothetical protein